MTPLLSRAGQLGASAALVLLLNAPALSQVRLITDGDAAAPARITNEEGVEILSSRAEPPAAKAPASAEQAGGAALPARSQAKVLTPPERGTLVSSRLTATPSQAAVVRAADPRRSPTVDDDDRVEILNQELSREGQDLIAKQRLLRLPRGTDALADELRQRIGQEVTHHEANIAALHREIDRLVQSQRRTVARR